MADQPVRWGLPSAIRMALYVGAVVIAALAVEAIVRNPAQIWAYVVLVGEYPIVLGTAWRECRLDDRTLFARGRTGATREVQLADLTQVARGFGTVWVRASKPIDRRGCDMLTFRMIPGGTLQNLPSAATAVQLIRQRAEAAGAHLDEPLPDPTTPRSKKPLIFST